MPRTRRFALLAVLALAGSVALVGCGRAQPGTAAYVGDTRYTERQIDTIVDQLRQSPAAGDVGSPRVSAVSWLVLADLGRRAAVERSLAVPASDYDGLARQLNLPAGAEVVRALADWFAVRDVIAREAAPVTPSEQDLRDLYNVLRRQPDFPAGMPFEEAAAQLRQDPNLPIVVSVRNMLRDAATRHRLVVNPRYRPLTAEVGRLPLVLASGSDHVTDRGTDRGTDQAGS